MKIKQSTLLLAALCAGLAGCSDSARDAAAPPPTNASLKDVKRDVAQAVETTKVYASENKDQFVAALQEKLAKLDQKISELGSKAATVKAEEGDKALTALRDQRSALGDKFDELKKATQETWKDVKAGVEKAYDEVEKAYDNAKAKLQ